MPFEALRGASYMNLATFRRDGREVQTPVWFAEADGRLYAFSEHEVGKVKRIRATGRVRVAPCDVRGGVRGAWAEGRGRIVRDADEIRAAYAALRAKYGWQMAVTDAVSALNGRIHRRAVLAVEPAEADGPA